MSRLRIINKRQEALSDIAGIMSAMKGLAIMETRILQDFLVYQQRMVAGIEKASAELFMTHPELVCDPITRNEICIVIGSEQGFCGDFNETLLAEISALSQQAPNLNWVIVGRRLAGRLEASPSEKLALPGAIVADEVPNVLLRLTSELNQLISQDQYTGCGFSVMYHCNATDDIQIRHLLPLNYIPGQTKPSAYPTELNIPPVVFLSKLTSHYLYAALNEVLYSSLMAENRQRQVHMDRALQRLDEERARLRIIYNTQRQEDITEEIEMILLSSDMLATNKDIK